MRPISSELNVDTATRIADIQRQVEQSTDGNEGAAEFARLAVMPRHVDAPGSGAPIEARQGEGNIATRIGNRDCWRRHDVSNLEVIGGEPGNRVKLPEGEAPPPGTIPVSQLTNTNPGTVLSDYHQRRVEEVKPQVRENIRNEVERSLQNLHNNLGSQHMRSEDYRAAMLTGGDRTAFINAVAAEWERANPTAFEKLASDLAAGRKPQLGEPARLRASQIRDTVRAELRGETGNRLEADATAAAINTLVDRVNAAPEGSVVANARQFLTSEQVSTAISSQFVNAYPGASNVLRRISDEGLAKLLNTYAASQGLLPDTYQAAGHVGYGSAGSSADAA